MLQHGENGMLITIPCNDALTWWTLVLCEPTALDLAALSQYL